jgi:hypothetical protein
LGVLSALVYGGKSRPVLSYPRRRGVFLEPLRKMLMSSTTLATFLKAQAVPPFLVLRDLAQQVANIIPETRDRFSFRRFWGEGLLSTEA